MRIERTALGLIATLALAAACSSGGGNSGNPDSGSGSGSGSGGGSGSGSGSGSSSGGAVDSGSAVDGEAAEAGPCLAQQTEPVSSPNGVLTNQPQITFTNTGTSAGSLTLVSAYFNYSNGYINWWGEAINNGTQPSCIPLGSVTMDGVSVTTTVDAPPYIVSTLTQTSACVAPGAKGEFWGIQQGTSFANISAVDYSFSGLSEAATPSTDVQVQGATISGQTVTGQVAINATVYNLGVAVYVHDCRGVVVDKVSAFPGNLDNLTAGQTLPFTTNPAARPFDDFVALPSWIEGMMAIREPPPSTGGRLALRAEQEAQMQALREAQREAATRGLRAEP